MLHIKFQIKPQIKLQVRLPTCHHVPLEVYTASRNRPALPRVITLLRYTQKNPDTSFLFPTRGIQGHLDEYMPWSDILYVSSHNVVLARFYGGIGEPGIPVVFSTIMFAVT
jgi:hypothetical protein